MLLRSLLILTVALLLGSPCQAQEEVPSPPATREQMATLVPDRQNIAGFALRNTRFTDIPGTGKDDRMQVFERLWGRGKHLKPSEIKTPADRMFADRPADTIIVEVRLFSSSARARAWLLGRDGGAEKLRHKLPNGLRFGQDFLTDSTGGGMLFTQGRAYVSIDVRGSQCPEDFGAALAEAVGRTVSYLLCSNTSVTEASPTAKRFLSRAANTKPAAIVDGVTWAPVSALQSAGVQVAPVAGSDNVALAYQGQVLTIAPWSRAARLDGKPITLEMPILWDGQEMVVPLAAVARALNVPALSSAP